MEGSAMSGLTYSKLNHWLDMLKSVRESYDAANMNLSDMELNLLNSYFSDMKIIEEALNQESLE